MAADGRVTALNVREALQWVLVAFCAALPVSIASVNIAAGALTVLVLLADAAGEDVKWDRALNGLSYALIAYFAVAALVSATGVAPRVSFGQLNKDFHKIWLLWLLLASLSLADERRGLPAFGVGLAAVAAVGVAQALVIRQAGGDWVRAHGFVHPVIFGELLAFGLLGGACLMIRPREAADAGATPRRLFGFFVVVAAAFLLNQTRGAFLGLSVGLASLAALDRKVRRWSLPAIAAGAVVIACWELLLPTHRSLFAAAQLHGFDPVANQQLTRLVLWKVSWRIFKDHPWLGVGIGNFKTVFSQYYSGVLGDQRVWGSAHNLYLHQLAERGLVGLAALLAVLATMTGRAFQRARERSTALNLWAFSACCAFLIMNLTEVAFQTEQVASLVIAIWALAESSHRSAAGSP